MIFLDYTKYNEKAAFNKINTGRMLILSETIPSVLLSYNAFEAYHNFKGSKKDIFKPYSEYHQQNPDELIDYYKSISKIENPKKIKEQSMP